MSYSGCYYKLVWIFFFLLGGTLATVIALYFIGWITSGQTNPFTSLSFLDWVCSILLGTFLGLLMAFQTVHEMQLHDEQLKQGRSRYRKKTSITMENPGRTDIDETEEHW